MRKRVKRLIAVGLGAVAVTAATQGPAAASGSVTGHTAWYDKCGDFGDQATLYDHGEKFLVQDTCSNGRGVRVRWRYKKYPDAWSIEHAINYTGGSADPMRKEYNLKDGDDTDLPEERDFLLQDGPRRQRSICIGQLRP